MDETDDSQQTYYGPEDAEYGIMVWGSQQGTVEEATVRLNEQGDSVKMLGVSDLAPYPKEDVMAFLESVDDCLVVEMSATPTNRRNCDGRDA